MSQNWLYPGLPSVLATSMMRSALQRTLEGRGGRYL